jgi:sRNA-binding regulator protein Hfq
MHMQLFKYLPTILIILSTQLYSETILFKDGTKVQGKIRTQDKSTITINTSDGVKIVSKGDITKVIYKDKISEAEENKIRQDEEKKKLALDAKKQELERIKTETLPKETPEKKETVVFKPDPNKADEDKTALGAFWRSALVPGWGQFYQGREWAGILYPTLILGGAYAGYQTNRIYRNALNDYNEYNNPYSESAILLSALNIPNPVNNTDQLVNFSGSPNDVLLNFYNTNESPLAKQKEAVEKHYTNLRIISYAVAAVWIWNAIDAFIFHPDASSLSEGNNSNVPKAGDLRIKIDSNSVRSPGYGYANASSTEHRVYLETYF